MRNKNKFIFTCIVNYDMEKWTGKRLFIRKFTEFIIRADCMKQTCMLSEDSKPAMFSLGTKMILGVFRQIKTNKSELCNFKGNPYTQGCPILIVFQADDTEMMEISLLVDSSGLQCQNK